MLIYFITCYNVKVVVKMKVGSQYSTFEKKLKLNENLKRNNYILYENNIYFHKIRKKHRGNFLLIEFFKIILIINTAAVVKLHT